MGWTLTNLVCVDPDSGTTVNLGTGVASIDLDPGETVTCTYTDVKPSVTIDKTGDTLSKVGDDVTYTITVENTSPASSPDLECTITDSTIGFSKVVTLAAGTSRTHWRRIQSRIA